MSAQIDEKVEDCTICHEYAPAQQKEPLIPSPISDLPCAMAASDIFTFESEQFLVLVDSYSKYIGVTIERLDVPGNDPSFRRAFWAARNPSKAHKRLRCPVYKLAKSYNFEHVLVSPKHP